jgi:hypothetical protein
MPLMSNARRGARGLIKRAFIQVPVPELAQVGERVYTRPHKPSRTHVAPNTTSNPIQTHTFSSDQSIPGGQCLGAWYFSI